MQLKVDTDKKVIHVYGEVNLEDFLAWATDNVSDPEDWTVVFGIASVMNLSHTLTMDHTKNDYTWPEGMVPPVVKFLAK